MDVAELRIAFNLSETIAERIRRFNIDRASKILSGETAVPLYDNAKIALHLVPFISFNPAQFYNITPIASQSTIMPPINSDAAYHRYNLDGFVTYSGGEGGKYYSYAQLFRSGIIEAVEALLLMPGGEEPTIPSISYEQALIKSFTDYLSVLKTLNVEPPIFVFLDLFGVRGYSMALSRRFRHVEAHKIDRDVLLLPEIIVQNYEVRAEDVLKTAFDSIWNACGLPRSLNYDANGNWVGR